MKVKNITDKSTPKVIGIGSYWLAPGEEKYIPNDFLYVDEIDGYGHTTGKKIVLPAITSQAKLNMLTFEEDVKEEKPAEETAEEPAPVAEEATEEPKEVVEEAKPKARKTTKKAATAE